MCRTCMVEGEVDRAEDAGDVRARIKAKLSPGARAAYERMSAMSDEEYMEMSHRETDMRMLKEMLEEIP